MAKETHQKAPQKHKKQTLGNVREESTWEVKDKFHLSCCNTQRPGSYFSQDVLNTY